MNDSVSFDDPLHDEMHRVVDHVYASPDLAQRVEAAARRRRAARWSGIGAFVLVALGTTTGVLIFGHAAAAPSAATATAAPLPDCAADRSSYKLGTPTKLGDADPGPVVPGKPAAAEVCRYAGIGEQPSDGGLAGSAKITSGPQLDRLLSTLDASAVNPSGVMYCPAGNGEAVFLVFAYPGSSADFVVSLDPSCGTVMTNVADYLERDNLTQLVADWTGDRHANATRSGS